MRHEHLYSKEKHNKHFLHRILAVFLLVSIKRQTALPMCMTASAISP